MDQVDDYLRQAIVLAQANVAAGGRPFGALIVRDGQVIAHGVNETAQTHDPSAHAEMQAIRAASRQLQTPRLDGCDIYASGQPCPMCLAAMYLTGIKRFYFAYSGEDGAPYGLSTAPIYAELAKPFTEQSIEAIYRRVRIDGPDLYDDWKARQGR